MPRLALRYAALAIAHTRTRALLAGLLMGTLVQALASQREGSGFALAMALVMVGSGSAAFLLHALATAGGAAPKAVAAARLRGWVVALGLGIVAGVHAPSLIGG